MNREGVILVMGQSGHPTDKRTAPRRWGQNTVPILREQHPDETVVLREKGDPEPLEDALARARCVVTYCSNACSWALLRGIPVFRTSDVFIAPELAVPWDGKGPLPFDAKPYNDRSVYENLAWCQWTEEEIASGEPFRRLALCL